MKRIAFLIFILFGLFTAKAQDTSITYFDLNWEKCDRLDSEYYRKVVKVTSGKWLVMDFFNNGQLQMIAHYKNEDLKTQTDSCSYFYENGQIKSSGNYTKGKKCGVWTYWFKNGKVDGTGTYKKGRMNGTWKWHNNNSSSVISAIELYKRGKIKSFEFYDTTGKREPESTEFEVNPTFRGGDNDLLEYLKSEVTYPESMIESYIEGIVMLSFVISEKGEVGNVTVLKSLHPVIDAEAVRVLEGMPNWAPGEFHNRPAKVRYNIPIRFKLT